MHEREVKPIWTSATFLVYTGGLTVLLGGLAALGYLAASNGSGATAAWALLILVILYAVAHALRCGPARSPPASSPSRQCIAWAAFVGAPSWSGSAGSASGGSFSQAGRSRGSRSGS